MKSEIAELCLLAYHYENRVKPYKQQLFGDQFVTDDSIWNFMNGSLSNQTLGINPQVLYTFMNKNVGIMDKYNASKQPYALSDCERVCLRYSQYNDGVIRKDELWAILRPLHLHHIEDIIKCRKKKSKLSKFPSFNYKVRDSLVSIFLQLFNFQRHAELMRNNIEEQLELEDDEEGFNIGKISAQNIQAYISDYTGQLKIKDCQIVLNNILGCQNKNIDKKFYTYFIRNYQSRPIKDRKNPNSDPVDQQQGKFTHFYKSSIKWNYGGQFDKHNSPVYL